MYKTFCLLAILILVTSCADKNNLAVDVSNIKIDSELKRFEQVFYNADIELATLKANFPYLFPEGTPDSIWLAKRQDPDEVFLFNETEKLYGNFDQQYEALNDLFKHVKYYYANFKAPKVITLISNVDYERRVIYADSLLLLSLDVYLGQENTIYEDFPAYIKQNFSPDHMLVDVAKAITTVQIANSLDRTFVSKMIQEGKRLYLVDAYLPLMHDELKIGYTEQQLAWAKLNEQDIWKYFIENKMLFSTDQELNSRFIEEAPFSKFYQANDNESPGRIGVWFGWQIVRSYMANNNSSIPDLLKLNNDELFKRSKYKPSK